MGLDPLEQWQFRRRCARKTALWVCALTPVTLALLWPYLPQGEVRGVRVDLGLKALRGHRVFGNPSKLSEPGASETADTALDALDLDLLTPLDLLRERSTWCGEAVPALQHSEALTETAERQAVWLARSGERRHHTPRSPPGATPIQRAHNSGYRGPVGEVIAWGQRDGQAVMDGWEA